MVIANDQGPVEPDRVPPSRRLSEKMSTLARTDTRPELALRSELHRLGLRYRIQVPVPGNLRRRIDIAFTRVKVAVFVDGCFWHGCQLHGTRPVTNREWWDWKFAKIQARDADTNRLLEHEGWSVIRVWEHDNPIEAARQIASAVRMDS